MEAAETFSVDVGTAASCRAFGVARSSLYRRRQPPPTVVRRPRASHRALSDVERQEVLDLLHSQRFVDQAPRTGCRSPTGRRALSVFGAHDVSNPGCE